MHRRHLHHYPRPMQHYLFPLLAAAALAGGGSQFPLRPDNGKTTTVSLHNTTPQAQFMSLGLEDDYDCYQRRPGVALGQNHRLLQLSAKANQSFFFSYMGFEGMNVTTCTGVITIPTKEGHRLPREFLADRRWLHGRGIRAPDADGCRDKNPGH